MLLNKLNRTVGVSRMNIRLSEILTPSKGVMALIMLFTMLPVISIGAGQQDSPRTPRVYTNDDIPSRSQSAPVGAASTNEASKDSETASSNPAEVGKVAPFVPTPMDVVEKMLEIAKVTSADVVYDLGSGDGRIVLTAAEKYGAKAVGVELDKDLATESEAEAKRRNLDKLVTIIQGDLFLTNVKPASVVTVYLLQAANRKLSPILEKDLKPGTRVVAHDIRIPDWKPVEELSLKSDGVQHFIYLYRIPDSFKQ